MVAVLTRSLERVHGVNWIAALGALLFAAAAIALLTQQWPSLSALQQLGAIGGATAVVGGAALGSRRAAPGTSLALSHLAGVLVSLVAGAVVVVAGGGWPMAALACGLAGVGASEALRRFLDSPIADLLLVTAVSVAAGGLAASVGVPAAPLVALSGLGLVVGAAGRRAGEALAGLGAASSLLVALDGAQFTGQGTLRDMGLLGTATGWAAPVAAAIAAAALAVRFRGSRDWRYLVLAGAGLAASCVASWSIYEPPTTWVGVALAALFVAIQATALVGSSDGEVDAIIDRVATLTDRVLGSLILLVTSAAAMDAAVNGEVDGAAVATALLATIGWLVGAFRRRSGGNLFMAAFMICLGLVAALVPAWIVGLAVVTTGAGLIVSAMRDRDEDSLLTAVVVLCGGWWVMAVDIALDSSLMWAAPVALGVVLYGELSRRNQWLYWAGPLGLIAACGVFDRVEHADALPLNVVAAVGAVAVLVGAWRRRAVALLVGSVMSVGAAGYQVLDASIGIEGWGWMALTGAALLAAAAAYEFTDSRLGSGTDAPLGSSTGSRLGPSIESF